MSRQLFPKNRNILNRESGLRPSQARRLKLLVIVTATLVGVALGFVSASFGEYFFSPNVSPPQPYEATINDVQGIQVLQRQADFAVEKAVPKKPSEMLAQSRVR